MADPLGHLHVVALPHLAYQPETEPMHSNLNVGTGTDCAIPEIAETIACVVGYSPNPLPYTLLKPIICRCPRSIPEAQHKQMPIDRHIGLPVPREIGATQLQHLLADHQCMGIRMRAT